MTSKERFLKVFNGELPDRVPVTLFIIDQGHFISQVYPDIDPFDYESILIKIIEFQKQLGLDVFVRMLYWISEPLNIIYGGLNVAEQTENWEVKTEQIKDGETIIHRSTIRTPDGILKQDFSVNELRPGTFCYACTDKPINTLKDLEIAIKYEPLTPTPEVAKKIKERINKIKAVLGNDGILGTWSPYGPFNTSSLLINENLLYSLFMTDWEFYEKLMNFSIDRVVKYTKAIDEAGIDVHCIGGNVPGGFLGKENYDNYILSFEKRYIDIVQQNGTPAMYHNCGQIMNLVESYIELGAKIVEPFSPFPLGDADLALAKKLVNGKYTILGGVDQVNVIQKGTIDEIKRKTEETMKIGKPGGRFILQSADFLEYGTPIKNVEAFAKTALENSYY